MTDRDLNAWKSTDVIDKGRFDDAYFEGLAASVEVGLNALEAAPPVQTANDRGYGRAIWVAAAAVAAALLWMFAPAANRSAPVVTTPPAASPLEALASEVAASLPDALAEFGEDDYQAQVQLASALAVDYGLEDTDDDETFAGGGSWMADLDDLTPAELARLAAQL